MEGDLLLRAPNHTNMGGTPPEIDQCMMIMTRIRSKILCKREIPTMRDIRFTKIIMFLICPGDKCRKTSKKKMNSVVLQIFKTCFSHLGSIPLRRLWMTWNKSGNTSSNNSWNKIRSYKRNKLFRKRSRSSIPSWRTSTRSSQMMAAI